MEYNAELVQKLMRPGEFLEINGVAVEIKSVPDGQTKTLDSRLFALEQKKKANTVQTKDVPPSLEDRRARMGGFNYNLCRKEIYTRHILVPTSVGDVPVWGYYPRWGRKIRPALVYAHGGGFFGGSPFAVENPCRLIAERADAIVWNVEYSLAPDYPFPIPCTQIYEVICWLHDHAEEFGMNPENIAIAGDSAGGNLCAVAAQMDRDNSTHYVKAQILLYPKLTFTNYDLPGYKRDETLFSIVPEQQDLLPDMLCIGSDAFNAGDAEVYVQGKYNVTIPYISPAFGRCEELPQTLLILAEYDGLRLEGEFYAKKLLDANVPTRVLRYCGVYHGFFDALGILPQSESAATEMAEFLNKL